MTHRLKLVSFDICPYVERSRIALLEKGLPHDVEYIQLGSPQRTRSAQHGRHRGVASSVDPRSDATAISPGEVLPCSPHPLPPARIPTSPGRGSRNIANALV
jgi:hypothetical protein